MLVPAIRFVAAKGARGSATIQLLCRVRSGVSANREGITAITEENIHMCVAAQARDGEANKAIRDIIATALKVPKSDVELVKGMKSRGKTVAIIVDTSKVPDEEVERIKRVFSIMTAQINSIPPVQV
ncbi:hypothetical protein GQ44DRAFT_773025 [Phaeosphaeriaceae sp. PMI808]|nr:hypothetical protein GQ44DRAFT_773025 [Phaeosphaeriaceae sp. PMI808]